MITNTKYILGGLAAVGVIYLIYTQVNKSKKDEQRFTNLNASGPYNPNVKTPKGNAKVSCWHNGKHYHDGPCTAVEANQNASTHYN